MWLRVCGAAQGISPVFARHSSEYPGGDVGVSGSVNSNLGSGGSMPPPPSRPSRYRRMSADATAVHQMAMMQAAGMQAQAQAQAQADAANDLVSWQACILSACTAHASCRPAAPTCGL